MTGQVDKKYWFKSKKYGWGWGIPNNVKGWISFGVFVAIWLSALAWLVSTVSPDSTISTRNSIIFAAILGVDVLGLVYVSFKYGEPPKWRWGNRRGKAKSNQSKSD